MLKLVLFVILLSCVQAKDELTPTPKPDELTVRPKPDEQSQPDSGEVIRVALEMVQGVGVVRCHKTKMCEAGIALRDNRQDLGDFYRALRNNVKPFFSAANDAFHNRLPPCNADPTLTGIKLCRCIYPCTTPTPTPIEQKEQLSTYSIEESTLIYDVITTNEFCTPDVKRKTEKLLKYLRAGKNKGWNDCEKSRAMCVIGQIARDNNINIWKLAELVEPEFKLYTSWTEIISCKLPNEETANTCFECFNC